MLLGYVSIGRSTPCFLHKSLSVSGPQDLSGALDVHCLLHRTANDNAQTCTKCGNPNAIAAIDHP
jgi:hypothetical protein